jgi:hypothetical protein
LLPRSELPDILEYHCFGTDFGFIEKALGYFPRSFSIKLIFAINIMKAE